MHQKELSDYNRICSNSPLNEYQTNRNWNRGQEAWLEVNEMRMLRWMYRVTKEDIMRVSIISARFAVPPTLR